MRSPLLLATKNSEKPALARFFLSRESMPARELTFWQVWLRRPQNSGIRKALFQIHLWIGLGVGLYVLIVSVSGSAIVFRRAIDRKFGRREVYLSGSTRRISPESLRAAIQQAFPEYEILNIRESENSHRPDTVVLERDGHRIERLFDPYTASDLGNPRPLVARIMQCLVDLHDNLLAGQGGRVVNGIGASFITLLSLSGIILWWPGIKSWRRSLNVRFGARFPRMNWDLHSAIGFWCSAFVFVWGVSGICLCFPGVLDETLSSTLVSWLMRLHFGRFNWATEALWTFTGLAPGALAITGALMWWNRLLLKKLRAFRCGRNRRSVIAA